jgi:RNA polymerase sigma-70 factor (ECF subfamily)
MSTTGIEPLAGAMDPLVTAATAGDAAAFSQLFDRHRHELQVHTFRILGSREDSEDLTQETFLRAWRMRGSYGGRGSFRAWLYRIATNTSLSELARRRWAAHGADTARARALPEQLLEEIPSNEAEPEADVLSSETLELAFLAAVQQLPPRQRAVLVLRVVLDWSANATAELLETSVVSVNSALYRARETLRKHLPEQRLEWCVRSEPSEAERALLRRYLDAAAAGDPAALVSVVQAETGKTERSASDG